MQVVAGIFSMRWRLRNPPGHRLAPSSLALAHLPACESNAKCDSVRKDDESGRYDLVIVHLSCYWPRGLSAPVALAFRKTWRGHLWRPYHRVLGFSEEARWIRKIFDQARRDAGPAFRALNRPAKLLSLTGLAYYCEVGRGNK